MNTIPGADAILVRYGDISTKSSRVRGMMEDTLLSNIQWTLDLAEIDATIEREWSRPIVIPKSTTNVGKAAHAIAQTLGVVSVSPCVRVVPELDAILDAVRGVIEAEPIEGSFAVDARRADKSLPFTSMDLEREAGSVVFETVPDPEAVSVDLEAPETTIGVEVRQEYAYLFTQTVDGPGGLPVGTQAPCVALISGGIDSPVAAYRIMRRGCPVIPLYIDLGPYSGPDHQARALESIARLRVPAATSARPAYLVPGGDFVVDLVGSVERGRMLVLRRFMFKVADQLADLVDAQGIVTGEALGQKSSQTATNLNATNVITRPIHRPLLTLDKNEITSMAMELGTFRSATIDAGCPSIAPHDVATQASPGEIDELEPVEMDAYVTEAVEAAECVSLEQIESYDDARETLVPP